MTSVEVTSSKQTTNMDNNYIEEEPMVELVDQPAVNEKSSCPKRNILVISLLLLITFSGVITGVVIWITLHKFHTIPNKTMRAPLVKHNDNNVYLYSNKKNLIFSTKVTGQKLQISNKCNPLYTEVCLHSENMLVKVYKKIQYYMNKTECYKLINEATNNEVLEIENCFNMNGTIWYNTFQLSQQDYILNKVRYKYVKEPQFGDTGERFWMSSSGVTVIVNNSVPLWTSVQHNKYSYFCLKTGRGNFSHNFQNTDRLHLSYTVCHTETVKETQHFLIHKYFKRPANLPTGNTLAATIWTSDTTDANQCNTSEVQLKQNIHNYVFSTEMRYLIKHSSDQFYHHRDSDFSPSLQYTPFISKKQLSILNREMFCLNKSLVLLDKQNVPELIQWHGKPVFILNVTKQCVQKAITAEIRDKMYIIKSDIITLTSGVQQLKSLLNLGYNMGTIIKHLTEFYNVILNATDKLVIADSGLKLQHLPILLQSFSRQAIWGKAGIKSVIPSALAYSLSGYGFVLIDSVGDSYTSQGEKLSPELFIRWLQTVILMPLIKVPVLPCCLDAELKNTVRKLFDLRKKYIPTINNLAGNFLETGVPIIRPLWWIAPRDKLALTTDTQFLLGDSTLVAPVLEPDTSSRDLYLPPGIWRDELRQEEIAGGREYVNYRASLHELPLFTKTADIDYH